MCTTDICAVYESAALRKLETDAAIAISVYRVQVDDELETLDLLADDTDKPLSDRLPQLRLKKRVGLIQRHTLR